MKKILFRNSKVNLQLRRFYQNIPLVG